MKYVFWTDGSASPNPGPGGCAVIEVRGEVAKPVILGAEKNSSNIRMEGWAILMAMQRTGAEKCKIYTDSQFWINVITKWMEGWERMGWRKAKGEIKNLDIVKKIYEVYDPERMELIWVQGHVGTRYNEMADEWAKRARAGEKLQPERQE